MRVPSPYQAAILVGASYRVWRLLGDDSILDRPRDALVDASPPWVDELLGCPWCLGWWTTLGWWGAFQIDPDRAIELATPWALATAVGAVGHALD